MKVLLIVPYTGGIIAVFEYDYAEEGVPDAPYRMIQVANVTLYNPTPEQLERVVERRKSLSPGPFFFCVFSLPCGQRSKLDGYYYSLREPLYTKMPFIEDCMQDGETREQVAARGMKRIARMYGGWGASE